MHRVLIAVSVLLNLTVCECCHSFKDTNMTVHPKEGDPYWTVVTGCVERIAFGNDTITEVHIKDQTLPHLERDAIRHLVKLRTLSIVDSGLETIEAALFRNVPRLKLIQIAYNDLAEIRRGIFSPLPQLEALKINNNRIKTIETGAFANITTLKEIDCGHNRLEEWTSDWFTDSVNVESMDFRSNKIGKLPRRAFCKLQKLKQINFDNNELEIIHPEAFEGITRLDRLGLRYNRLVAIDPRIFSRGLRIKSLAIGANYLNYLPIGVLTKIVVEELETAGNPWKCPCLDQIHFWLFENNATVKTSSCVRHDVPVCRYPSVYSYTCIGTVDEELTGKFVGALRQIRPPLDKYCARLD